MADEGDLGSAAVDRHAVAEVGAVACVEPEGEARQETTGEPGDGSAEVGAVLDLNDCLLYTSPSPRD